VLDAEAAEQALDQLPARRVGLDEAQYVLAGAGQRKQAARDGGDTGADCNAVVASLQFGEQ
jgi:hypothetical protein